jgi:hypothetical protein
MYLIRKTMNRINRYLQIIHSSLNLEGENLTWLPLFFRLIHWMMKGEGMLVNFFMLKLHKKEFSMKGVLVRKEFDRIHNKLNPIYYRSLLEDKYVFDRFLKSYGYPLAEMTGLIENNNVYWLNENVTEPLNDIIYRETDCFVKMLTKWGGLDVYKLSICNKEIYLNNDPCSLEKLKQVLTDGLFIMQKTIKQHEVLNRLNSSCVNTIRMITIHDGTRVKNFYNFFRMGSGAKLVDNLTQGGLGCGIHSNGTLHNCATDVMGLYTWIKQHPVTGVSFGEITLPYYQEALDLVVRMHNSFHCFFIIGWDIAMTETGPVIIEGNPIGDLMFVQWLYGSLKEEFLQYANSYEKHRGYLIRKN